MVCRVFAFVCFLMLGASPAAAADSWTFYNNTEFGVSTSPPVDAFFTDFKLTP